MLLVAIVKTTTSGLRPLVLPTATVLEVLEAVGSQQSASFCQDSDYCSLLRHLDNIVDDLSALTLQALTTQKFLLKYLKDFKLKYNNLHSIMNSFIQRWEVSLYRCVVISMKLKGNIKVHIYFVKKIYNPTEIGLNLTFSILSIVYLYLWVKFPIVFSNLKKMQFKLKMIKVRSNRFMNAVQVKFYLHLCCL